WRWREPLRPDRHLLAGLRPSSAGHRWKERHFVARLDPRFRLHHVLVDRRAHRAVRREHLRPFAAARAQMIAQRRDRGDVRRQLQLLRRPAELLAQRGEEKELHLQDRKSTRLNSSHVKISYAVFCLKKKKKKNKQNK